MVLLIDNYDSFTYNLYDYITQLGTPCQVLRNDCCALNEIQSMVFDKIVISPGPGIPRDAGICNDLIAYYYNKKPMLGICLGFQAIGEFFGAELTHAKMPMHGKTSSIHIDTSATLFRNLHTPTQVMRYHSLILKNLPLQLTITGKTTEDEIMAFEHEKLPLYGVQFHPESILTPDGLQMMANFLKS